MKKLSKINESLWMDSIKRSNSNEKKKEDEYHYKLNIPELEVSICVDGVYWANDLLRIEDDQKISISDFNEIPDDKLNGWRLPTLNELQKLKHNHDVMFRDIKSKQCKLVYDIKNRDKQFKIPFKSSIMIQHDELNNCNSVFIDQYNNYYCSLLKDSERYTGYSVYQSIIILVRDEAL